MKNARAVSRRSFLKTSLGAAATIGFPTIVPSTVFGQYAPRKRINVGAIGVGRISRGHDMPSILPYDRARIIAVCDAYQAMTADRPYSEALSSQEAIAELRRESGGQFDPKVVDAFCAAFQGKERLHQQAPRAARLQEALS